MIRPILQLGNDFLRKRSLSVNDFSSLALEALVEDLSDTLHDAQKRFGYGRGIAAPQISELKRVVFIDAPHFTFPLVNPRIVEVSDRKFEVWDSCFSFNVAFFLLVDRHYSINVEYFDLEGQREIIYVEGRLSELLQHEIDHLDGVLATDRMKDSKKIIMRSEWQKNP